MSTVLSSFAVLTTHNALCCVFSLHQLLLSVNCTENTPFNGSPDLYCMPFNPSLSQHKTDEVD